MPGHLLLKVSAARLYGLSVHRVADAQMHGRRVPSIGLFGLHPVFTQVNTVYLSSPGSYHPS